MKYCLACGKETGRKMYCGERCRSAYRRKKNTQVPRQKARGSGVAPGGKIRLSQHSLIPHYEPCYLDECNLPIDESIVIEHPDLKKLQLTLRVSLCKQHKYLLREVA